LTPLTETVFKVVAENKVIHWPLSSQIVQKRVFLVDRRARGEKCQEE
jgi:hypothetical protein